MPVRSGALRHATATHRRTISRNRHAPCRPGEGIVQDCIAATGKQWYRAQVLRLRRAAYLIPSLRPGTSATYLLSNMTHNNLLNLLQKLRLRVSSEQDNSVVSQAAKVIAFGVQAAKGITTLGACDYVGLGARVQGRSPTIVNHGHVRIGNSLVLRNHTASIVLETAPSGTIEIGDSVFINFGSLIGAKSSVRIGNGVLLGPYSVVCDTEYADPSYEGTPAPIVIEDDVWLAARVTVMPGSRIGRGSVITAGSIVEGTIPAGVVAGGCPATVRRQITLEGTRR